jgi:hypothetical protein
MKRYSNTACLSISPVGYASHRPSSAYPLRHVACYRIRYLHHILTVQSQYMVPLFLEWSPRYVSPGAAGRADITGDRASSRRLLGREPAALCRPGTSLRADGCIVSTAGGNSTLPRQSILPRASSCGTGIAGDIVLFGCVVGSRPEWCLGTRIIAGGTAPSGATGRFRIGSGGRPCRRGPTAFFLFDGQLISPTVCVGIPYTGSGISVSWSGFIIGCKCRRVSCNI